jgi:hypothetical protein
MWVAGLHVRCVESAPDVGGQRDDAEARHLPE